MGEAKYYISQDFALGDEMCSSITSENDKQNLYMLKRNSVATNLLVYVVSVNVTH